MRTLLSALLLPACTIGHSPKRYSQAQLNSIETRVVEAGLKETFDAAMNALFDAGYVIAVSDRDGGIITGSRAVDQTTARVLLSSAIRDTQYVMSIQVRETKAGRQCAVRVKLAVNGEARVHKETIDELWVLMQRQVLMKEPPKIEPEKPKS